MAFPEDMVNEEVVNSPRDRPGDFVGPLLLRDLFTAPLLGVWIASMTSVRAGIGIAAATRLVGVVLLWRVARAALGASKPAGTATAA